LCASSLAKDNGPELTLIEITPTNNRRAKEQQNPI